MPDLYIDRLTLKIRSGDAEAARRLAQRVSAALAHIPLTDDLPAHAELVRVTLPPAGKNAILADRIAAGIHRGLRRG